MDKLARAKAVAEKEPGWSIRDAQRAAGLGGVETGAQKDSNPKKAFGNKKPPLAEFPMIARIHASLAHLDGSLKYGFRNWRDSKVDAQTYIQAIYRHTGLYEAGEDYARDTKVHNLGGVMACCAILLDAELHHALIDNRRHSPEEAQALVDAEAQVVYLQQCQAEREAKK